MLYSVELYHEVQIFAEEIEIVAAEGTLAAELQVEEAPVSEELPQESFVRGLGAAEISGAGAAGEHLLILLSPHPGSRSLATPLPRGEGDLRGPSPLPEGEG